MRPALFLVTSMRAAREIDEARLWWTEHGGVDVLDDGIAAASRYIQAFPEAPPLVKVRGKWSANTRRASVEPVGYNLFYEYDPTTRTVLIVRFRHRSRRPPRL
jgi:plasmid stabilization system protein ParE